MFRVHGARYRAAPRKRMELTRQDSHAMQAAPSRKPSGPKCRTAMQVQIVGAFGWLAGAGIKAGQPLRYRNSRDKSPFSPVTVVQQQAEHPPSATVRRAA